MKVGIVGLSGSGKTTLFRALTRCTVKTDSFGAPSGKANIGVVAVPDHRVDYLARQYNPKKITYASIEFIDGAAKIAKDQGRDKFGSDFFADVRQVDMLVHVVRGFEALGESPTPIKDVVLLNDELTLSDLVSIENRMTRVEKQLHGVKKGAITPATIEMELLERLKAALESGNPLTAVDMTPDEEKVIRSYDFLTLKPMIAALNIPESEISLPSEAAKEFRAYCREIDISEVELCAEIEMEVSELADDEEAEFLESVGISEPARNVLIRECYNKLGLISFITAGDPEVRAWTLRAGSKAVEAAGTIHSDLARGFIRAEVANFQQIEVAGGWEAAKTAGNVALHGKDYIVQDGDVIYIRFKV